MDPLERVSKEKIDVQLEKEEYFDDEVITVVGATSSVTPIHENWRSTSTPIRQSSGESSNKKSRGQTL